MRITRLILSTAIVFAIASGAQAGDKLAGVTHLRPLGQQAAALLADAQQKSATVRNLVTTLDAGDVVAYVQVVPATDNGPQSSLQFLGASHAARFVLIQVADCKKPCRRAELLGHELQHVAEVMARSWVIDDGGLQQMLALTGYPDSASARGYETPAAGQAERRVRRDIATGSSVQ